ncbi:MAG: SagB family peptide dehydrogenase, partial [Gemmatimonadota bacterium]|nr:SagB family peptide dehydrogenase [Gemmatimonadota bacterium]
GRDDRQVQLRGHRVEPGEVEAHVARFEGVREACVAAVDRDRGGPRLVAWVVWEEEDRTEALKGSLAAVLPAHMLPGEIVTLEALPLTPNGKVDRSALVPPDAGSNGTSAPRDEAASPVETTVLEVIREVLEVEVPADGNLLAYGADSIDMVRIGNRLEERFGDRPAIDEIFRLQTPGALAGFYADRGHEPEAGARDPLQEKLASYRVALAPEQREAFKARKLGTRDDLGAATRIDLPAPIDGDELEAELWSRRSHRRYALRPIAAEAFGGFLAGLRERPVHGRPKRLYASPGGLYPTQAYLHVKPGRVEDVPGGTYYYHPLEHRLVELASGATVRRDIHVPFVNAPIFDEAAFSIFLVVQLEAIGPAYGERSLHFATLEAGVIAASLEAWAPRWGIGLCQIGDIRFEDIRHLFRLDEGHVFLHSLVGGRSAGEGPETWDVAAPEASRERLLEQIADLSPEEVARILEARGEGKP